jgi:hypothetical protein
MRMFYPRSKSSFINPYLIYTPKIIKYSPNSCISSKIILLNKFSLFYSLQMYFLPIYIRTLKSLLTHNTLHTRQRARKGKNSSTSTLSKRIDLIHNYYPRFSTRGVNTHFYFIYVTYNKSQHAHQCSSPLYVLIIMYFHFVPREGSRD